MDPDEQKTNPLTPRQADTSRPVVAGVRLERPLPVGSRVLADPCSCVEDIVEIRRERLQVDLRYIADDRLNSCLTEPGFVAVIAATRQSEDGMALGQFSRYREPDSASGAGHEHASAHLFHLVHRFVAAPPPPDALDDRTLSTTGPTARSTLGVAAGGR